MFWQLTGSVFGLPACNAPSLERPFNVLCHFLKFNDLKILCFCKQNLDVVAAHVVDMLNTMKKYLIQLTFILEDSLEFCQFITSV